MLLKRSRHLECYPRFSDYRTSHCSLRCNATVPFLHDNLSVGPCSAPVTPNSSMGFPGLRSYALQTFVASSSTNYCPRNIILPNPPYTRHVHVRLCRFDFLLFSFNRTRHYGLVFCPASFARSNCAFHFPIVTVTCLRGPFDTREVRNIYSYSRLVKETYLSSAMGVLA